ncbi:hypothetical protein E0990_23965 [Salmonella enterica subsp. enterica serovar Virchow]|nr:hypothetical protein [Salmonella enterica subsp. enterica serovar Virchow]ECI7685963.1 hypothetical protein [Salmonella enterica subsp. enterica serovar Paratyphi A]
MANTLRVGQRDSGGEKAIEASKRAAVRPHESGNPVGGTLRAPVALDQPPPARRSREGAITAQTCPGEYQRA